MPRITIIGAGFAALTTVRTLRAKDKAMHLTVIAPKPEFLFYPSLIWIPSGLRSRSDVVVPLEGFFQRMRVDYHAGAALGLEDEGRTVITSSGRVENDGLIIACGGRYIKQLPGIEHAITPCQGVAEAEAVRDRLKTLDSGTIAIGFAGNPQEATAVRGGPMFEFLFGLHNQLKREGRRDRFRLVFFNPMLEPGKRLGPKAVKGLMGRMTQLGIETHLGHKLTRFEPDKVVTAGGEFQADLILFTPGMTGPAWVDQTSLPRSPGGMIQADAQCRVTGFERVYVAGDAGSFPGPDWLPKQAHMADLQAAVGAENLFAELNGRTSEKTFRTELVCVVDDLETGVLVARTPRRTLVLPPLRLFHWSKRLLEWWYLRDYRRAFNTSQSAPSPIR
ncbi:MAG: NAD(P)/FAD-dependent oxidoreductase [Gammaproteobacteria bacterium]